MVSTLCTETATEQVISAAKIGRAAKKIQTDFETKHCSYNFEKNVKCANLYDCWKAADNTCNETCKLIEANGQARAADNETGMRLQCLLQVLFGEYNGTWFQPRLNATAREGALNLCKDKEYDEITASWLMKCAGFHDQPHMSIDCKCNSVSDDDDFLETNYFKSGLGHICSAEDRGTVEGKLNCCKNKNISITHKCNEPDDWNAAVCNL